MVILFWSEVKKRWQFFGNLIDSSLLLIEDVTLADSQSHKMLPFLYANPYLSTKDGSLKDIIN